MKHSVISSVAKRLENVNLLKQLYKVTVVKTFAKCTDYDVIQNVVKLNDVLIKVFFFMVHIHRYHNLSLTNIFLYIYLESEDINFYI